MMQWVRMMGISTKLLVLAVAAIVLVVLVNYAVFIRGHRAAAEVAMMEKAAAFTAIADETKSHVSRLNAGGAFDRATLMAQLKDKLAAGGAASDTTYFGTVPIVAGWTVARIAAAREHLDFKIAAFNARNKANEVEPGSFRAAMLEDLETQVKAGGAEALYRVNEGDNAAHYMRAIRLTQDCMLCHGDPATSPTGDGLDPAGFRMEGWKVGDVHGAYEVVMPLSVVDQQVAGFVGNALIWSLPLCALAAGALVWTIRVVFTRPIKALVGRIRDIAEGEGDLTRRLEIAFRGVRCWETKGSDAAPGHVTCPRIVNHELKSCHDCATMQKAHRNEIDELSGWFNSFIGDLHNIISRVTVTAREVAGAATQIAATSEQIATGTRQQEQQVGTISAAAHEMSSTVAEVARKTTEAAGHAEESRRLADEGGKTVGQTIEDMRQIDTAVSAGAGAVEELGRRSEQIGQIVQVINDIADQTNLLALNAAIEAARAGEQGRGFAVVADEVRKLADRTTRATEEITGSITAIQAGTSQAVQTMNGGMAQVREGAGRAGRAGESLTQIVRTAQSVSERVTTIAAAAEQQAATAEEIGRGVEQIAAISRATSEATGQAAQAATQLSGRAEDLSQLVSRFKTRDRAEAREPRPGDAGSP